jgi:hypothetical protein
MKYLFSGFIVVCFLLSSLTQVQAQSFQFFEGGGMYYHFDYNEDVPAPLKSSETGWLPGFRGVYGFDGKSSSFYSAVAFEYTQATTDYDGTTQQGVPIQLKSKHTLMRGEADLGYGFKHIGGESFELTPYIGAGYRYWERRIGDNDPGGYRELYTWWYIPVGVKAGFEIDDSWKITCDLSARVMLNGNIKFDFAASDPTINSPDAQLGNKIGMKASAPIEVQLSPEISLKFGPWYEHSAIGVSNDVIVTQNGTPVAQVHEPDSATNQYGVDIGIRFEF